MKILLGTVTTVLMATISFFVFHSAKIPEDNQAITCGKDTIAIEVDTLSLKATEKMDPKTPTTSVDMTSVDTTTVNTTSVNTSSVNTPSVNTSSTTSESTTTWTTTVETAKSEPTTASSSETTGSTFTTTFVSSTEATSSSATTTEPRVTVYKNLTISDSVNQSDVIPGTTLNLILTDSENNCFTSEAEVSEDGYVTFIFKSDDEHLITSGLYGCYCPELGIETILELD